MSRERNRRRTAEQLARQAMEAEIVASFATDVPNLHVVPVVLEVLPPWLTAAVDRALATAPPGKDPTVVICRPAGYGQPARLLLLAMDVAAALGAGDRRTDPKGER